MTTTWTTFLTDLDDDTVTFWETFAEDEAEASGVPVEEVRRGIAREHAAATAPAN